MSDGFWGTLEVFSVSADWGHPQYLEIHKSQEVKGAPLCEDSYKKLREVINLQMINDYQKQNAR